MLTRPPLLPDGEVAAALRAGWDLTVAAIDYRAVGAGSHHWTAVTADGTRWFVTADDLAPDPDAEFTRLEAALATAAALGAAGAAYVVAPVPTGAGTPVLRATTGFGIALYPEVEGEHFAGGELPSAEHRAAVLQIVAALHQTPAAVVPRAGRDDFALRDRDQLLDGARRSTSAGPYAEQAAALLAGAADRVRTVLARYDRLVATSGAGDGPFVLTHGEPHAANTIRTAAGWVLVDWESALLAPPERDLWAIDPGDGSAWRAYERATGTHLRQAVFELYRIRWDLTEIGLYAAHFARPHTGNRDDDLAWRELQSSITNLG